ncbi:MAG: helix-turn-helix transcriptional regulator [Planctomycetia bacterium]|jgi:transcriptional regulator with XRE-family HTH domain
MIANATVKKVVELLEEGQLSQRQIAKKTGISRGSVGAIARGTRSASDNESHEEEMLIIPPSGAPTRCHSCGRLVQQPCLACQIRAMREKREQDAPTESMACSY